ncbi:MAG: acyl carrier protein [Gammaproteobacteria bacterium]
MDDSTKTLIRNEFRALLPDDFVGEFDDRPLAELGIDSLDFFEVVMVLEDRHGIVVPVEEMDAAVTLNDVFAACR